MSRVSALKAILGADELGLASDSFDVLRNRVMVLNEWAWEGQVPWEVVNAWLENFDGKTGASVETERLHALYILSQFLYFGSLEIRVLLRALYRDLVLVPIIQAARKDLGGTRDVSSINAAVLKTLKETRFLGVGTPSESGVHLLYYFRQENNLSKGHFLDSAQVFEKVTNADSATGWKLRYPEVKHYIFVDDVCGSGETAVRYTDWLEDVCKQQPDVRVYYYALFATEAGLQRVRAESIFKDNSGAVFELDESYKSMAAKSRYLKVVPRDIDPDVVRNLASVYGALLWPSDPLGYEQSELLLGFHHNTPDNTLPIIWMDQDNGAPFTWRPAFRRYPKL